MTFFDKSKIQNGKQKTKRPEKKPTWRQQAKS